MISSVAAALLPTSFLVVIPLLGAWGDWQSGWLVAIAISLVLGTVVSLPGALIVARKLEAPGDDYRAFE